MSTVICITGMHRSGTSLTASWLERCGLAIHAGRVVTPAEGNPRGHFEDLDIVRLHSGILQGRGLGSVGWGLRGDRFLAFRPAEREKAQDLAAERAARSPVWGWKDPRTVLFLDQWKQILPELNVLVVWRPAAEVVDSLLRRSRRATNPDMRARARASIGLWKAHNRLVLDFKGRHPARTVLLPLHGLVAMDGAAFELIEERFGLGLRYTPIIDLFEPGLLSRSAGRARRGLLAAATAWQGCGQLEQELLAASDVPAAPVRP